MTTTCSKGNSESIVIDEGFLCRPGLLIRYWLSDLTMPQHHHIMQCAPNTLNGVGYC